MSGGKHLLLLAVFLHLARCQNKLEVKMSPEVKKIFSGDLLYLSCKITAGSTVKWYFNNVEQKLTNEIYKIGVASPLHSGSYYCESNGQKSNSLNITVLEWVPGASLNIETGQPVMRNENSVVLQLENEDGLNGWNCWAYRGGKTNKIKLNVKGNDLKIVFQPKKLNVPETIFWCTDNTQERRSNQQVIRTSGKDISLEMYPWPAVVGESLTLRCLTWGTNQISSVVFYKENSTIKSSDKPTYEISDVTKATEGRYKCVATFTHEARTAGPPYHEASDMQDVFVQTSPVKAFLSETNGLSCSCPLCAGEFSYHYYKKNGQAWALMQATKTSMQPDGKGTYACRAVLKDMRSLLSNVINDPENNSILLGVVVVLFIVGAIIFVAAILFYRHWKKRSNTGPIYEDMPMRSRDGEDRYEQLKRGGGMEREYDTLHSETQQRKKKDGEYEALKKGEMKDGVYHTLGMEGEAGGGGYEALKKEGMKGEVYHTLGMEKEAGGGGYEALKKEGMKGEVYHTLGMEGEAGGGGYEALKREGMKGEVYHTLGMEGEAGGGGYEALKREGMKGEVYHTLGMEKEAGEGGYEALKREGMKGEVYHTLGMGGAAGGEGEQQQ